MSVKPAPLVHLDALGQGGRTIVDLSPCGRGLRLTLSGSWHDSIPIPIAEKVLHAITQQRPPIIGVDLSGSSHLASITLGFLVQTWQEAQSAGAADAVMCAQPKVAAMVKILGLNQFFRAMKTPAELEAAMQ